MLRPSPILLLVVGCGAPDLVEVVVDARTELGVFQADLPLEASFTVLAALDTEVAEVRVDAEGWEVTAPEPGLVQVAAGERLGITLSVEGLPVGEHSAIVDLLALDGEVLASTLVALSTEEPDVVLAPEEPIDLGTVDVGGTATAQGSAMNRSPFAVSLTPELRSGELGAPGSPVAVGPGEQAALVLTFTPSTSRGGVSFDVRWSAGPFEVGSVSFQAQVPEP